MLDIRRYRSPRLGSGDARLMMLYTRDGCTSDDGRLDVRDSMMFGVSVFLPGKISCKVLGFQDRNILVNYLIAC